MLFSLTAVYGDAWLDIRARLSSGAIDPRILLILAVRTLFRRFDCIGGVFAIYFPLMQMIASRQPLSGQRLSVYIGTSVLSFSR